MTHSNKPASEKHLRAHLEAQPEYSLAWEALQHGLSWDDGVLDWALIVARSSDFYDVYGMGAEDTFDAQEFVINEGHLDECLAILRDNLNHEDAPSALLEGFFFDLYFFGMKLRVVEILDHLGIDY